VEELPDWLVGRTGPYGSGCAKGVEFLVAWLLLLLWDKTAWPPAFAFGPLPSKIAIVIVLLLAVGVNIVLAVWSRYLGDGDNDNPVRDMLEGSRGRKLHLKDHIGLAALAFGNAWCEEMVSRGFIRHELQTRGQLTPNMANFWQALAFGFWHYHGIPSGIAGVALTFVYGGIMGLLCDFGGGMILPLVAHTIADYYILSSIARQTM